MLKFQNRKTENLNEIPYKFPPEIFFKEYTSFLKKNPSFEGFVSS